MRDLDPGDLEDHGAPDIALWMRSVSRRGFLAGMALTPLLFALAGCTTDAWAAFFARIETRPVRRNINAMTATDPIVNTYRDAVAAMKLLPSTDPWNRTNQAEIHNDHCPHRNWLFLPWHREYLYQFERICRQVTGVSDFALPYWDWTTLASVPSVFWNSSDALFDQTRTVGASDTLPSAPFSPASISSILAEPNFDVFGSSPLAATDGQRTFVAEGPLENGPHDGVHVWMGGDMGTFMSPLDPVFWCHHNMIERLWVEWNIADKNPNTNDSAWVDRTFTEFVDDHRQPVTATVVIGLLYPLISYRYE